ncbi:MAG: hypothetical protein ACO4AZ_08520 [Ilumatobacteraceae bacterium]
MSVIFRSASSIACAEDGAWGMSLDMPPCVRPVLEDSAFSEDSFLADSVPDSEFSESFLPSLSDTGVFVESSESSLALDSPSVLGVPPASAGSFWPSSSDESDSPEGPLPLSIEFSSFSLVSSRETALLPAS